MDTKQFYSTHITPTMSNEDKKALPDCVLKCVIASLATRYDPNIIALYNKQSDSLTDTLVIDVTPELKAMTRFDFGDFTGHPSEYINRVSISDFIDNNYDYIDDMFRVEVLCYDWLNTLSKIYGKDVIDSKFDLKF